VSEPTIAARDLLRRFPLIDGHNDLPWELRERGEVNLAEPVTGTHTDLPRLAAGGVGAHALGVRYMTLTHNANVGWADSAAYPALFAELFTRGWTEPECAALAGGNLLRVLRAAESAAGAGQDHTR
jgi:microsomal dipeptidase-like Zn-dependent dipeptidase